jgi:hypothetical protein
MHARDDAHGAFKVIRQQLELTGRPHALLCCTRMLLNTFVVPSSMRMGTSTRCSRIGARSSCLAAGLSPESVGDAIGLRLRLRQCGLCAWFSSRRSSVFSETFTF